MVKEDIFKIKPIDGKNIIVEDKRKLVSPFNAAKHLKDANIPAYCDQCVYRSVDSGGNGKCPKYEKGAVCSIRDDYIKIINTLDTRKPDDVKAMLDMIAKISFENVLMALTQAKMDGNVPDRNTKSEINTLLAVIKSINDLNTKVVVTQQTELDEKTGDISSIFKQIKAQGVSGDVR